MAKVFFNSKLKDGSVRQIAAIKTFKYAGEVFAYHDRIVSDGKPKSTTFSVSHVVTGICIDAGFGYESFDEARTATKLYVDTVGKKAFKKAIQEAMEKEGLRI